MDLTIVRWIVGKLNGRVYTHYYDTILPMRVGNVKLGGERPLPKFQEEMTRNETEHSLKPA
ncbi:MAG: hypothetical protein GY803_28495 [Chloroflexi bacterium]|nr:hypothetical protein [Chloroflexota bacterium]